MALKLLIEGNSTSAIGAVTSLGGALDGLLANPMVAVGAAIAVATVAVAGFGVASTKMAGDFQQSINQLYTSAGESKANLQMVGDGILQMSTDTATSTKQLTDGMYMVESAGFHGAQGLLVLKAAAEGAKAENAPLADVANAVTSALNAYGLAGKDATWVTNDLVAAVGAGKMHMADLATALSNVLPVSARFKISLTDTTAAISTMTMQGDDASSAATHLRQMILALEAPAKAGATALKSIGLSTQQVSNEMKISLPDTIQMITDALGKKFPEGSAAYNQALKNIAGGSKQMMALLELSGQHLQTFKQNVDQISGAVKNGGNSILGWDTIQGNFNFKMEQAKNAVIALMIGIGTQLLPTVTNIVGAIAPVLASFADWVVQSHAITNAIGFVGNVIDHIKTAFDMAVAPIQKVKDVMKPVADSFGDALNKIQQTATATKPLRDAFGQTLNTLEKTGSLFKPLNDSFGTMMNTLQQSGTKVTPMLDSFDRASGVITKTTGAVNKGKSGFDIFLGVIQNVAKAMMSVNWAAVWTAVQNIGKAIGAVAVALSKVDWGGIFTTIGNAIKTVSAALSKVDWGGIFAKVGSVLQGIGTFLKTTFMPVWAQLVQSFGDIQTALKPIMPQLQQVGQMFMMGLGVAIILVISIIAGLISALAGVLSGVAIFVTGVIQFFSGLFQFIGGIMSLIGDLLSGHWEKIGADLDGIMWGLVNMFLGAWNMIKGIWTAATGFISGFASGFATTIVGIFTGLWDTLVGHSIIPDMVNGIISWFLQLGPRGLAAINTLITDAKNALATFASQAVQLGSNIVQGIANGIAGAFGFIGTQMNRLTSFIGSFLPHSPAEQGELSHLNEYGPSFVKGFANGIVRSLPMMHAAMSSLTGSMMSPSASFASGSSGAGNAFALSGGHTIIVQVQPAKQDIILNHRKVGEGVMSYAAKEVRVAGVHNR